jgi:hypothetical protein
MLVVAACSSSLNQQTSGTVSGVLFPHESLSFRMVLKIVTYSSSLSDTARVKLLLIRPEIDLCNALSTASIF